MSINDALRAFLFHFGDWGAPNNNEEYVDVTQEERAAKNLVGHVLHEQILSQTASSHNVPNVPLHKLLEARECNSRFRLRGCGNSIMNATNISPFGNRTKAHISQQFIPSKATLMATYNSHIFCGMFSSDGTMFMSACKDGKIRLYDTSNWKVVNTIHARNIGWSIISTDYSPDQQWLIYSTWSPYVHMANTRGEHQAHNALDFEPSEDQRFCLFSVQFSPDSREILGGSSDSHLYIYDLDRNKRIERVRAHRDDINAVAYADKSNQILFSGSDDSLIKVWDRRCFNSDCVGILPGHSHGITFIDSKMDGKYLISNSKDQTIKLWDLRLIRDKNSTQGRESDFHYNSYYGARGYQQLRARPQRHKDDQSLMTYFGHKVLDTLIRCRFSPKESTGQRYIYTGSYDGTVYIYDIITGKCINQLSGHTATVRDVHWHPTKPILISSAWDGRAYKWESKTHPSEVKVNNNNTDNTNDNNNTEEIDDDMDDNVYDDEDE